MTKMKKVLIVGMLDSIHLARWLIQFENTNISFLIFPSRTFRSIHPKLLDLTRNNTNYKLAYSLVPHFLAGYFDFAVFRHTQTLVRLNLRGLALRRKINRYKPAYVHALEIQGAGYLCDRAIDFDHPTFKLILTNWGSDIFYYQNFPAHREKIRSALRKADFYSAECLRDYKLATFMGFNGINLPCVPNAGGFDADELKSQQVLPSKRRNIVVKAYGGIFGRGNLVIEVLRRILPDFPNYNVFLYSVTPDVVSNVSRLANEFPDRVSYSLIGGGISHEALREIFLQSRIYIGCSISDGISTSFLEALTTGAYPIQTDTSCAGEWLNKGAIGDLIPLNDSCLLSSIRAALENDELVDAAGSVNLEISKTHLDFKSLSQIAHGFYS